MEPQGVEREYARLSVIPFKPPSRQIVRLDRPFHIPQLHLIYFRQILLVRRRPPEIPFVRVMRYSLLQHPGRILGVRFPIRFVSFREGVCGVVGFGEVFGLDGGGAFKREACFFALCTKRGLICVG